MKNLANQIAQESLAETPSIVLSAWMDGEEHDGGVDWPAHLKQRCNCPGTVGNLAPDRRRHARCASAVE